MRPRIIRGPRNTADRTRRMAPAATRVIRTAQLEALTEADRILREAREEARTIASQAHQQAETARVESAQRGLAEAATVLVAARRQARQIVEEARDQLTRLALAVAGKLLGEELRLHPDAVQQIVAQCLRQATAAHRVLLRVSPVDVPTLQQAMPRLQHLVQSGVIQLEPDLEIHRGDCLVETEVGQIDGRLATRLELIGQILESGAAE